MQKKSLSSENKYQLTQREKEILVALSEGTSYKSIASNYFITIDTVRSHIKNIYQKMQVHKQLEAVTKARNEGIVP
jgi:DNA-binding NarL/FixJ family response regulator